MFASESGQLID